SSGEDRSQVAAATRGKSHEGVAPLALGLEGVVVAETQLSEVDGAAGRLEIAGQPLEELSGHISFEALCQRMWRVGAGVHCAHPARPRSGAQRDLTVTPERLGTARVAAHRQVLKLGDALGKPDGMDALRAAIAHGVPTGDDFETALQP